MSAPPRKRRRPKSAARYGPVPSGAKMRALRLTDEEWSTLERIALEQGLGDGRGGRTDAVQWLIARYCTSK